MEDTNPDGVDVDLPVWLASGRLHRSASCPSFHPPVSVVGPVPLSAVQNLHGATRCWECWGGRV